MNFVETKFRLLAEQDGQIEKELKQKLTDLFNDRKTATKAYLAVADYGAPETLTVALCLRASPSPDTSLVKSISSVFASIFSSAEHLDILFIDEEQERRVGCSNLGDRDASAHSTRRFTSVERGPT